MFATTILGWTISAIWMIMLLVVWIFIALLPANIAKGKGHSFWGYFIFSLFFFPLALIVALVISDKNDSSTPTTPEAPTAPTEE